MVVGIASIWRFFAREGLSLKRVRAAEQDRADVRAAREAWQADQLSLDPARLVFFDGRADGGSTAPPPTWPARAAARGAARG